MALTEQRRTVYKTKALISEATRVFFGPRSSVDSDAPLVGALYPGSSTMRITSVEINYYYSATQSEVTAQYSSDWLHEGTSNLTEYEHDISTYARTDDVAYAEDPQKSFAYTAESYELPCAIYRVTKYKTDAQLNLPNIFALTGKLNAAAFLGEPALSWMFKGATATKQQWDLWRITYVFEYHSPTYDGWKAVRWDETTSPPTKLTYNIYFSGNFDLLAL